jgi:FixJ family two-component response regulator
MNKNPIIIVDDDNEDLEMIQQAFAELNIENEIIIFNDGLKFLDFLRETQNKTFFILCDINMSVINGLELKQRIYEDEVLRLKCMPFVFLSTSGSSNLVMKAYSYGVQGYFIKPANFQEIKDMLLRIVNYWSYSQHPNI